MADPHVELPGSFRPIAPGARRIRDIDPNAHVEITLILKAPALPEARTNKKPLTPEEFASQYGATSKTLGEVERCLRGYGLHLEAALPGARTARASGTAEAMQAAFKAGLAIYSSPEQGEFRGREGALFVPSQLAELVTGVLGLDERPSARPRSAAPLHGTQYPGNDTVVP